MGKKNKKKEQKGKGAEKTAAKTIKKATQRMRKELAAKGEEDIEKLILAYRTRSQASQTVEEITSPPSCRSGLSICAHPEKEELFLFAGEFNNGNQTAMFNDLFMYNIKKDQWRLIKCTKSPPPRCSHQAVVIPQSGGQMWIFGGEFASPSRSQFYHYKDLWVYHITKKQWEEFSVPGGPSARSGHRMVLCNKKLIVFGGFNESFLEYKYFNDVHAFDLETYKWSKLETNGFGPTPRSGCQVVTTTDGKIIVYGGYSRESLKKDVDKGIVHTDMFVLQPDVRNDGKWIWSKMKQSGCKPSPRSGFSVACTPNNRAYFFGGVFDEEDADESFKSTFYNELYTLDLLKGTWSQISLHKKSQKSKEKSGEDIDESLQQMESLRLEQPSELTSDDGVFTVKVGGQAQSSSNFASQRSSQSEESFVPCRRINCSLVVKHGQLYMYGGLFEEDDKQFTLNDFYVLDIHKLDEWRTIVPFDEKLKEWLESSDSEGEGMDMEEGDEEMTSSEDDESDDEDL